eukprot:GGOE01036591.1.p1 GENE.GGOE01036591.1~~GGOE01036591.1.p1  ORF type:complete len:295 (+),score=51.52 GGOE01036591.1:44-886(+)
MPGKVMVPNPLDVAQAIVNGEMETEFEDGAIYVGNVDYEVTKEELMTIFNTCGPVKKVTIPLNRRTGSPQGYAYVTFDAATAPDAVPLALGLDGALEARGRVLKITAKRVNLPGLRTRVPYTEGNEAKRTDPELRKLSSVRLAGDWLCPCGTNNFSWRDVCYRCGAPCPHAGGVGPMRPRMLPSQHGGFLGGRGKGYAGKGGFAVLGAPYRPYPSPMASPYPRRPASGGWGAALSPPAPAPSFTIPTVPRPFPPPRTRGVPFRASPVAGWGTALQGVAGY